MPRYYKQTTPGTLLLLMRHGATDLNTSGDLKVRGWVDCPLSQEGRFQARATVDKLKPYEPKYVYHSDFMRDCETGRIVADAFNIPTEADFDLRTWDVGSYSGQDESIANPALLELYKRSWETPKGSSESFDGFSRRFFGFLDAKIDMAANRPEMRPLLLVSHGRNLALTHSYIEGLLPWKAQMPFTAGLMEILVDDDRGLRVAFLGKTEPVIEDR